MFSLAVLSSFTSSALACTVHNHAEDAMCAETCLDSSVGAHGECEVADIVKYGKLKEGSCSALGYAVKGEQIGENAGQCRVMFTTYFKAENIAPELSADVLGCTTYSLVDSGTCAEACLDSMVGICPVSIVAKFGNLNEGNCADQGYTNPDGTMDQKAGPCGTITFNKYTKPSEKGAPILGCTKYYRADAGTCAEACLGSTVGICPISLVTKAGKLNEGSCQDQGYTTANGSIDEPAGPCGTITFTKWTKPGFEVSSCKPITTQTNFNLTEYVSGGRWYIHQQMAISYLPAEDNYCTIADYTFESSTKVKVHNYANKDKVNGDVYDSDVTLKLLGGICGVVGDDPARLSVGPCAFSWISRLAYGPYWIVAAGPTPDNYQWALVSGGQPTNEGENGCSTGTGVNGSGLWIFTRSQQRDQQTIDAVRSIAEEEGFDLSVLNDVDQEGCTYQKSAVQKAAVA